MSRESLIFAISGTVFGLIVGWLIGSQRPVQSPPAAAAQAAPAPAQAASGATRAFDQSRAEALATQASSEPANAAVRAQLGNVYFDADRFDEAIRWYQESLGLNPRDPNVSTDLGIAYYYTNQADRALEQFAHSLSVDPVHTKTLLNQGIVLAFAKQDLDGAARSWERVVELAPASPEGQAASRALEGLRSAHPAAGGGTGG